MYKYDIDIPRSLSFNGLKPWEITVEDIMEVWKGGGRQNSSLLEVSYELGVENPKRKMSGDQVHDYFWNKKDISSIIEYCEGDVSSTIQICKKLKL